MIISTPEHQVPYNEEQQEQQTTTTLTVDHHISLAGPIPIYFHLSLSLFPFRSFRHPFICVYVDILSSQR